MSSPLSRLKILCIHGHNQNAQKFREKTGSFRKALNSIAEFDFIESTVSEPELLPLKTWFTTTPEGTYKRNYQPPIYNGTFEESSRNVRKYIEETSPNGILAFSQGAAFTHAMLKQAPIPNLQFVIFVCGFICKNATPCVDDKTIISVPTLHCINKKDQVIESNMCEELASNFTNPIIKYYDNGHCIPPPKVCKDDFVEFLNRFSKE